ncbi:hypothetical protein MMC20_007737 [Loxospora ochrophaea]|nr:hypothetical protein [Loxospora ochrophaea]
MSAAGEAIFRTHTNPIDIYDHAINLVDTTAPADHDVQNPSEASEEQEGRTSKDELTRKWTRGTLREELVRRKYAKYQEGRNDPNVSDDDPSDKGLESAGIGAPVGKQNTTHRGRFLDKLHRKIGKKTKAQAQRESEVDILYENQRGWFLCGIPLYSSKSLLNLDPAAWQTAQFEDSPVNITNAQVPDPSWHWDWKSWYVDMSHDVDEEGWEYSFAFRYGFAWHGTHPWFHSFVRRRRWLRRRVKAHAAFVRAKDGSKDVHMLAEEYFTIHPKRNRSRQSSADRAATNARSSATFSYGHDGNESDSSTDEEEINDILALLKALRNARVDRRKIESVKNFLEYGGEELHYLPERMPDVMSFFIYQTSRRQLLAHLVAVFTTTTKHRDEHVTRGEPESEEERRRLDNLLKAVNAADENVKDLQYWSDIKKVTGRTEPNEGLDQEWASGEDDAELIGPLRALPSKTNEGPVSPIEDEIKGIPDEVFKEPGINRSLSPTENQKSESLISNKGKEKA